MHTFESEWNNFHFLYQRTHFSHILDFTSTFASLFLIKQEQTWLFKHERSQPRFRPRFPRRKRKRILQFSTMELWLYYRPSFSSHCRGLFSILCSPTRTGHYSWWAPPWRWGSPAGVSNERWIRKEWRAGKSFSKSFPNTYAFYSLTYNYFLLQVS